jgi:hypothetical protein
LQPIDAFGYEAAEWFLKAAEQGDKDGTTCPVSKLPMTLISGFPVHAAFMFALWQLISNIL